MKTPKPISHAAICWQTDHQGRQVPISADFDDIYFSSTDGLAETQYVFIAQNHLAERFLALFQNPDCHHFVIAETGFGTGLNFLATAALWQQISDQHPNAHPKTLYFISSEKYPLSPNALTQALQAWSEQPTIDYFAQQLIAHYPPAVLGCHRRHFCLNPQQSRHRLVLDLWFGDANDSFEQLANSCPKLVDAWFLDGFAPNKNHELWSDNLFANIHRLSHTETTLATFSAAGDVRRKLIAINATPAKVKGFGHKREMLTACFDQLPPSDNPPATDTALIIGAGVCGLLAAYALACRGTKVTLVDKTAALAGASGNPCALFSPKLSDAAYAHNNLSIMGFLYAYHHYQLLNHQSDTPIFYQTGVVDFLLPTHKNDDKLAHLVNSYPDVLINQSKQLPISSKAKSFHAFLPDSGLVLPNQLAKQILRHPLIDFKIAAIEHFEQTPNGITAHHLHGTITTDIAVVCAGFESHQLHSAIYEGRKIRGQVSWLHDTALHTQLDALHPAIKYDGYACIIPKGSTVADHAVLFGASFVRNDESCDVRIDEHRFNLDKLQFILADAHISPHTLQGRASIRCQTPDYHPIVGKIADRLYAMTAMGSKGFSVAALCSEVLAAMIFDEPMPITHTLAQKLAPNRARLQIPLDLHH